MRPIDADALIDRMYHDAFETDTDMQKWESGCWIRYKMFENAIDEQPTIEPKQGEWIDKTTEIGFPDAECSVCGSHAGMFWMNYCPNCGARMSYIAGKHADCVIIDESADMRGADDE